MSASSPILLNIGVGATIPSPAPLYMMEAVDTVTITHSDGAPSSFQMTFRADRAASRQMDFPLLAEGQLNPGKRVTFGVILNGTPNMLFDGFITHQELVHDKVSGASTLSVSGEDVSVMMDLIQRSMEYPGMGDTIIAAAVLAPYALLGVIPEILPSMSLPVEDPIERSPQQNSTDRAYLNQLASAHGYVFHVRPGPAYLMNTAYWGPPLRISMPQPALTIDQGPMTNVDSMSFQYDALQPTNVYGFGVDDDLEIEYPVLTFSGSRLPPFAAEPAIIFNQPFVRKQLFSDPRLGILDGLNSAQSITDFSTDKVVTASGKVDGLRYGNVLQCPGIIGVRGAGISYDGMYYVQSVTHTLRLGSYTQEFKLTREGLMTTVPEVMV